MLGIILHHIYNEIELTSPILGHVGYLATAIFFFISGYGNTLSIKKKRILHVKWIAEKVKKLYLPFIIAYVLFYLGLCVFNFAEVPVKNEIIEDITTISLPNQVSWFPKIILLCFFMHWISVKTFENNRIQNLILIIGVCIYIITMYLLHMPIYWYNSVFCYAVGCVVANLKMNSIFVDNIIRRKYFLFILTLFLFSISFWLSEFKWYFQITSALLISLLCFCITFIVKFNNTFFEWIGNKSFEFYLFHATVLKLCIPIIPHSKVLYAVLVIVISIIIVYLYSEMKRKIEMRRLKKKDIVHNEEV